MRRHLHFSPQQAVLSASCNWPGRHNVVNALAAAAAGLAVGLNLEQIVKGLREVKPVTGRLQPWISRKGNIVIDDTYNANAASLKAGLDVLTGVGKKPWLVLGAFAELGPESLKMHQEMGKLIKSSGVVRLLATGSDARATVEAFGKGASFYETQEELIGALVHELTGEETILKIVGFDALPEALASIRDGGLAGSI